MDELTILMRAGRYTMELLDREEAWAVHFKEDHGYDSRMSTRRINKYRSEIQEINNRIYKIEEQRSNKK